MDLADLATGDTVVVDAAHCPRDNNGNRRDLTGVILLHPREDQPHCGTYSVLVHFEGVNDAWLGEDQFRPVHSLYERTKGKRCWWVHHVNIKEKVRSSTKATGGHCTICNHFNEYQSGPYTCWVHTH